MYRYLKTLLRHLTSGSDVLTATMGINHTKPGFHYNVSLNVSKWNLWCDISKHKNIKTFLVYAYAYVTSKVWFAYAVT